MGAGLRADATGRGELPRSVGAPPKGASPKKVRLMELPLHELPGAMIKMGSDCKLGKRPKGPCRRAPPQEAAALLIVCGLGGVAFGRFGYRK